jgi:uncharacterized membrane protein YsdA (DUF1294 family)/cold shock CspA family protein
VRTKGKITDWNDAKGYGFISPLAGGDRTFVHIKAFANRSRRPGVGDTVTFTRSTDARGRPRAEQATLAGTRKPAKRTNRGDRADVLPLGLAFGFLFLVAGAVLVSAIPVTVLVIYLLGSAVTFAAYALDKSAAQKGRWRTSENTLHLLALVGGWPGALVARNKLRHKTRKQPFRAVFWVTVLSNCALFFWLLSPEGKNAWRSIIAMVA